MSSHGGIARGGALALMLAGLAACDIAAPVAVPSGIAAPPRPAPPASDPSAASRAVADHFAAQERGLRARGLMRTDGGGADTPFSAATLAANFTRIALFNEYSEIAGRLVQRSSPAALRRWEGPVRLRLEFGEAVAPGVQRKDGADVAAYASRLARATRHPVSFIGAGSPPTAANFHILVLTDDERRVAGPRLRALVPGIDSQSIALIEALPLSVSCVVLAFSRSGTNVYSEAVALIRAELPDLTRLSCYHEEIGQGLGLPNDSPQARPSIFNDNEEFALLTRHDEALLRILYDPRLRPGMREPEARDIIQTIATELTSGES
jgi:hypothetical protein